MPDWIRQLNNSRRLLAVLGLAASLVPIWLLVSWASAPAYVPLFRELNWGDVGRVVEQLDGAGIDNRLEAGGSSVAVPAGDLARARVILAQEGYGVGRPGLELFDKTTWGMTDFSQRVTYRRALEGELARTIGQLRGVTRAQVHLTLPETSPLRRLERPAEAAVVVAVGGANPLPAEVVQGITHLVSNSVEHLTADNVAVLDNSGRMLSAGDGGGTAGVGLSSRQLELQRSIEEGLAAKALEMLDDVLGAGNARVQLAADLNFEQVERTIESYNPDGQVIASEELSESGDGTPAGSSTISHNTFQNSRTFERIVGSVGGIKRLTVAVMLSETAVQANAGGDANQVAGTIATLDSLVRNAVGFDAARGDLVTVAAVPFDDTPPVDPTTLADPAGDGFDILGLIDRFSRPAIAVLGLLFTFALALRVLRLVRQAPAGGALEAASEQAALPVRRPDQVSDAQQVRQALLADGSLPETASQVVRAWLSES